MKKIILLICALALFTSGILYFNSNKKETRKIEQTSTEAEARNSNVVQSDRPDLECDSACQAKKDFVKKLSNEQQESDHIKPSDTSVDPDSNLGKFLSSTVDDIETGSDVLNKFNTEPRDHSWAKPFEEKLQHTINSLPPESSQIQGYLVSPPECRSTMCRIEFSTASKDQNTHMQHLLSISQVFSEFDPNQIEQRLLTDFDTGVIRVVFTDTTRTD